MTRVLLGLALYLVFFSPLMAQSGAPIITDSRVKTFVYNENDVFTVMTHYGYQSNIEFAKTETVKTVSVGDRVAWQVIPAGRRLFIKAMEENAHTNMTVVTNKRAYQFDLRASGRQPLHPNEELVYVVRFYYPESGVVSPSPAIYSDQIVAPAPMMPAPVMAAPVAPVAMAPQMAPVLTPAVAAPAPMTPAAAPAPMAAAMNYNYTYTGPSEAAPVKIFDDGRFTYFSFTPDGKAPPEFYVITPDGRQNPIQPNYSPAGEAMLPIVAPKIAIRRGAANIMVYNEQYAGGQVM